MYIMHLYSLKESDDIDQYNTFLPSEKVTGIYSKI